MPRRPTLTEDQLIEIYQEWRSGLSLDELARKYHVSKSALYYNLKRLEKEGKVEIPHLGKKAPDLQILRMVGDELTKEASQRMKLYFTLGRLVVSTFFKYAAADPKYAQNIHVKPLETMIQYIADSINARLELMKLKDQIAMVIDYLLDIIERQRQIIDYLLPRVTPAIKFEVEARMALELIEMAIMARLLGIRLDTGKLSPILRKSLEIAYRRNMTHVGGGTN